MKIETYQDQMARLFPEESGNKRMPRTVTWQVTDACNLCCTYCYQINKKDHIMSWEVAKAFCDMLLNATPENNSYINPEVSSGLIMEFIGGEPFLAIDLIDKICDYMINEMIERQHPWATRFMISICSNGVLYFDPRVQAFMEKHRNHFSFSITVDGCKELHDACRIFPDGSGSYDLAMAGVNHFRDHFQGHMGSKMTLAPGNVHYTFRAVKNLIENGYDEINLNCVYEKGWTAEHAKILYDELCKTADYILENDLFDKVQLSIFDPNSFQPKGENELENWCFGKDTPVLTPDGYRAIQELQVGDLVYTSDGTIHPVVETHRHWADNVVKAKAPGEFEITCTDNHNFYVLPFNVEQNSFDTYCKKELKDIQEKDLIRLFTLPDEREDQVGSWTVLSNDALQQLVAEYSNNSNVIITTNYYFAQELLVILRTIGYAPACSINDNNEYEICLSETQEIDNRTWTSGITYVPTEPQEVYNITVDENHSYVAGGFVVSNCGGLGDMLSCDWKGDLYPCIRYMESSLGDDCEPIRVGNVYRGILTTPEEQQLMKCMACVNRRTQSTDECFYCPIAQGCSWCFAAGTKITTPNGFENIEELKVGDVVIDVNGDQQPVENVMSRFTDDTVKVVATGILPIFTTKEHPFLTKRVRHSGDQVLYDSPEWIAANELKTGDRIAMLVEPFGDIDVEDNLAYLVGRYVGDGWKVKDHRSTAKQFGYHICCAYDETERLEYYLNNSGISYYKDLSKRTAQEYGFHKKNRMNAPNNEKFISLISDTGIGGATNKKFPDEVFNWNEISLKALLKGYFAADGHYDDNAKEVHFTTVSQELAIQLQRLLLKLHIKANITSREATNNNVIENRVVHTNTIYEIRFYNKEMQRHYHELDEDSNIMWVNVRVVEQVPGYEVYNLTVANTHTYIANNIIVHNCSAYNYQDTGSYDKRATHICIMHKARALANAYFYNMAYIMAGERKAFHMYIPDEWALEIIDEDELLKLKTLEEMAMDTSRFEM